jgi:hypothetical protein
MNDPLFHPPGLAWFWALNDACDDATMDRMIDAFARARVAAVILHPRAGLLKPYGGDEWFACIERTVRRCARRHVPVWLYDEDPYPSGGAGGLVVRQRPEFVAREIQRFVATAAPERPGLFCFPGKGALLWCGFVNETTGAIVDLTRRVGVIRRRWSKLNPWDSRYYYPATPRYGSLGVTS